MSQHHNPQIEIPQGDSFSDIRDNQMGSSGSEEFQSSYPENYPHQRMKASRIVIKNIITRQTVSLFLLLLCCCGFLYEYVQKSELENQLENKRRQEYIKSFGSTIEADNEGPILPKILWLYTEYDLKAQKMVEQVLGHYLIEKAKQSGWEVKLANSWTAYQYISEETAKLVTYARQNQKISEKVDDLLRYALIMDNGGLMIRVSEALPIDNFTWIQDYFSTKSNSNILKNTQTLLFSGPDYQTNKVEYQDFMLVATKKAKLVRFIFNALCYITSTGKLQLPQLRDAIWIDSRVNSTSVKNLSRVLLRSFLKTLTPTYFKSHVLQYTSLIETSPDCRDKTVALLAKSPDEYIKICGTPSYFIPLHVQFQRVKLEQALEKLIDEEELVAHPLSYWKSLMMTPYNQQLFEHVQPRPIHYCVLDAHPSSNFQQLSNSLENLKKQTYKNWTAVYFYESGNSGQSAEFVEDQHKKGVNIILSESSSSIGRNYELGIVKYCPNKSFVVILRRYEKLSSEHSLEDLIPSIQPRDILGAYVSLNISGRVTQNRKKYQDYNKMQYSALNPKYDDLNSILNHLRVFHSDNYKIIPQFDIKSPQGIYTNDRFVFLEHFIYYTIRTPACSDHQTLRHEQRVKWFVKSARQLYDVPFRINFYRKVLIETPVQDEIDKEQLARNRFKEKSYNMQQSMDHLVRNGQPIEHFVVFNPAHDEPYTKRNKPNRIPKKIHQIWVGKPISEAKMALINITKSIYPDFQYKLWGNEDITRENFPLSYDLIQSIFESDKYMRYSRLAVAADVMRHEILYREGGFWLDTEMYIFRRIFDKWLSYKVVNSGLNSMRHRWIGGMSWYSNEPGYQGLRRITSHANTNRYDIFQQEVLRIAGNYDFRQFIIGDEEYDPDILYMNYDTFYPTDYGLADISGARCALPLPQIPQEDEIIIKYKRGGSDFAIIKNCGKYYPYSYARESGAVGGGTWFTPRW